MASAQCPTLSQTCTLDPCGGQQPCNLCPGDVITIANATGTNLKKGTCVNWYLGTTPNFNPYSGQGQLLGCSKIALPPPDECSACPQIVFQFIDACGSEAANEFMVILSGSGFYVDNAFLDFDDAVNGGATNDDVNTGGTCNWMQPSAVAVASLQTACPGAIIVPAGPGDIVPPGVPVMIYTSAGFNFNYNWGSLCPLAPTIYVMQNGCNRTLDAFPNGGGGCSPTTIFGLECGCADDATYNCGSVVGGNGAFFTDYIIPFYGNAGCGFPNIPVNPPPPPPIVLEIPPFDTTLWTGLCNMGPYYIVGIMSPLPAGCPQVFTNYMPFNVVCPAPMLLPGTVCNSVSNFDLNDIADPNVPDGVWSGQNVSGNNFNALNVPPGTYNLTFNPDSDCAINATTTMTVFAAPKATLSGGPQTVCAGQPVNLTVTFNGSGPPYTFIYAANGVAQPAITAVASPHIFTVTPSVTTSYTLLEVEDFNCPGTVLGNALVTVLPAPSVVLTGNDTICAGQSALLFLNFAGTSPWTYSYSADGIIIDTLVTSKDPDTLAVNPTDTTVYKIVKIWNATCPGSASGTATILVPPATAGLMSGSTAICGIQPVFLNIDFSGGVAPWTFVFSVNNVNQPPVTTSVNPYILTVNPSQSTTYALVSVMGGGNCPGVASGTATVTFASPPTANMTGNASICPGNSTPISIDFAGGVAPWTFVYSINTVNQQPITTSIDPYILNVSPTANAIYQLVSVSSGSCAGVVSGLVNIVVGLSLPTNISGSATIMSGGSATLILNVPGAPPGAQIIYNLSANGVPISPITTTQNPYNYNVMPLLSTVYLILSCTVNGCPAAPTGNAVVTISDPQTSATISGSDTICNGQTVPILVSFAGDIGPYSFVYAINGVDQPSITTLSNPHVLMVSPTATTFYTLSSAIIGGTPASELNGVAEITVLSPTLNLTPSNLGICEGGSANLVVGLSGAPPPFTFIYSINNAAQPPVTSNMSSITIPVSPSFTTTYNLVSGSANGCTTSFNNAQAQVTVSGPPTADNVQIVCNQANGTYSVNFMVNSQPAPAGATLVNGSTVSGGQYFSTSIPISQPYSFQLSNGCGQSLVAGQNTCSCTTDAGTMSFLDTLEVCVGGAAVASHENDQTLAAGDLFHYILHTNPGLPVGNLIATNPTSPTFSFDGSTMAAGQVYWISSIAGSDNGSGQIDLLDTCLSVATGTPVVFFNPPTMTIEVSDTSVCPGTTVQLVVKMTGNGPFHFTYSQNGAPRPPVDTPNNNYTIGAVLQSNTTFQITSFNDATCSGFLPQPVTITVNQVPTIFGATDENCDLMSGTYTISATLQGGNGFYLFSGGGGSINGAFFQSSPIPIGTSYNYLLGDTEQCGFVNLTGNPMCVCATDAGQYPFMQPLIFCGSSPASLPPIFGSNLDPNDTLIYVLHTSPGPDPLLWTILQTNDQPFFNFIPGLMTPGQSYFISAIAANQTPAGIDFTDPCRSVSPGVEVIWAEPVSAFLTPNTEICQGDTAHLMIIFSGNDEPYEFTLLKNGVAQSPQISPTDTFFLNVNPSLSVNYSLLSVDGNNCAGSINGGGGATVSVKLPPNMIEFSSTCDFFSGTYVINFKITNGADTAKTWLASGTPGTLSSDSIFTSDPIPFGTSFDVLISSLIGCELPVQGLVVCNCTSDAGSLPPAQKGDFCTSQPATVSHNGDDILDATDAPLHFILFSDPTDPEGSILATSPVPASFNFNGATMTAGVIYYVAAIVGDDDGQGAVNLLDPCLSVSQSIEIVFHEAPTAVISGMASVCPGGSAAVQIAFTGTGPWNFQYAINGLAGVPISTNQATFNVGATALNSLIFNLITVSDALCNGTVSGSAEIKVKAIPTAQLSGATATCPGRPIQLSVELTGGQTFTVQISSSEGWDTTLTGVANGAQFWVSPNGPGPVSYSVTALSTASTDCPPEFGQPVFINVEALFPSMTVSKYGFYNLSCPGASDGSLIASAGGGQPPYNFQWAGGQTTASLDNLPGGNYALTISDSGGCSDSISIVLNEPPPISPELRGEASDCFGSNEGQLSVEGILGGNGPFQISLDGNFSTITDTFPLIFNNLPAGNYLLEIEDANGCTAETPASVPAAQELLVNLGPDLKLLLGDSVRLEGLLNLPISEAVWSPINYLSHPDSVISWSRPTATIRYQLTVKDEKGCTATDFLLLEIDPTRHIYVPSAFRPESDGPNDRLTIFAGREVEQIRTFQVFDRWGDAMFLAENFQPNDPATGWDGSMRGKKAGAAVYVWWMEVEFVDGEIEVFKGDVTLVR